MDSFVSTVTSPITRPYLAVCHSRCVKTGKGMQSNTTMSIKMFNDYTRQLHVSVPTGHLQIVFKRTEVHTIYIVFS